MNFLAADVPDPTDFPPPADAPGLRALDGSFRCDICGDLYDAPATIACGHCFCSAVRFISTPWPLNTGKALKTKHSVHQVLAGPKARVSILPKNDERGAHKAESSFRKCYFFVEGSKVGPFLSNASSLLGLLENTPCCIQVFCSGAHKTREGTCNSFEQC